MRIVPDLKRWMRVFAITIILHQQFTHNMPRNKLFDAKPISDKMQKIITLHTLLYKS